MKRRLLICLCLLLCLPALALGEDFLVTDTGDKLVAAQPAAQTTLTPTGSAAMKAAIELLSAGSYLDAYNAFAKLDAKENAKPYADYAQAKLLLLREKPAAAMELLKSHVDFLDSQYLIAFTEAQRLHRYVTGEGVGYVNAKGEWFIAPQFDWAERVFRAESALPHDPNNADYAPESLLTVAVVFQGETQATAEDTVPVNGLYGLVRNDGELIVPARYNAVLWTVDGVAAVTDAQGAHLFSLTTGEPIGDVYEEIGAYAGGFIPVRQNGLWAYLNPVTGETLGDGFVWETAQAFSEGRAAVSKEQLYGFIDLQGKTVIPLQYTGTAAYSEGKAAVRVKKKWGFIDTAGTMLIAPAYAEVGAFQLGLCAARKSSDWGMIDTTGAMILRAKYSEIGTFDPIYHRAWIRQNKLWGLVSATGAVVLKPAWGFHDEFDGNTLCRVAYRNAYGFIDAGGKTRIQNLYAKASPFTADYAGVLEDNGQVRYISKAQRSYTVDTDVPVECRQGFIEGRKVSVTEQTLTDTLGEVTVVQEYRIAYALYDGDGNAISIAPYTAAQP